MPLGKYHIESGQCLTDGYYKTVVCATVTLRTWEIKVQIFSWYIIISGIQKV